MIDWTSNMMLECAEARAEGRATRAKATRVALDNESIILCWDSDSRDWFNMMLAGKAPLIENITLTWGDEVNRLAEINNDLKASFPRNGNKTTIDWDSFGNEAA